METPREILRRIRRLEVKTRGMISDALAGQYRSVFKGQGMNFDEVREYQPGDEVRSIDWNVTARMDEAFVKKFTEERELSVLLLVDVSASGEYGSRVESKRELAAEVACLIALNATRNGDKVGLVLFSGDIELYLPPKKGRQHALRVLREILFFEPKGRGTDVAGALRHACRVLHRRSVLFLLSDFQSGEIQRDLALAGRRHDLIAMPIMDPCEAALPNVGRVVLENPETGEACVVNTGDPAVRRAYAERVARWREDLLGQCRKAGVDAVTLRTGEPYLVALRNFFTMRERRLIVR